MDPLFAPHHPLSHLHWDSGRISLQCKCSISDSGDAHLGSLPLQAEFFAPGLSNVGMLCREQTYVWLKRFLRNSQKLARGYLLFYFGKWVRATFVKLDPSPKK